MSEEKNKGGRPPIEIDEELLESLARIHCSAKEMADIVGVNESTIRRRYGDLIKMSKAHGKMNVRRKQLEVAMGGNVPMLIWLGKNWLGQSDSPVNEEEMDKILPWTDDWDKFGQPKDGDDATE